jgi:thiamine monophosphate synthase
MIRYYVTDRHQGDILACASRAVRAESTIQVREKDLPARNFWTSSLKFAILRQRHSSVLVNDRLTLQWQPESAACISPVMVCRPAASVAS